jgi:uncharacterized 2Fe-2S/4Fe-4S cluster protein (DUF4445 family)
VIDPIRVELQPLGESFEVERGSLLQDVLFAHGVEFPCGGRGRCKGCRVKLLRGDAPPGIEESAILSREELEAGSRLACRMRPRSDVAIEVAQWETTVLADHSSFEFTPSEGLGAAVDLGTTTIVVQLLDLADGRVLGVRTALNPQARHGGDVMSRVQFAVTKGGAARLRDLIRAEIGGLIESLLRGTSVDPRRLCHVVLVGNSVMHHLFCGIDLEPLSRVPFEPVHPGLQVFRAADLGWTSCAGASVRFLACLGSFVGSDILAGILATRMHEGDEPSVLVDLGTNGEIVVGNKDRLLCTSTAAGPAFEGARISMGMRAATGAVSRVEAAGGGVRCHVIGEAEARGICGSGLVDAAAVGLELGLISPTGRFADRRGAWELSPPVAINQADLRELQLAKGAIAAGIHILLRHFGASREGLARVYLAGAFGNYINLASARRIGLLDFPEPTMQPSGNTALLGAKIALFQTAAGIDGTREILARTRHVGLNEDPEFQDTYVSEMSFPSA